MWKLYVPGREGVAVKTTVGTLLRHLGDRNPTLGRVRYRGKGYKPPIEDYEGIPYAAWFLFRKTPEYEHEREVRAVLFDGGLDAHAALNDTIRSSEGPDGATESRLGEAVPINLAKVIQRIVVSPGFPKWAIQSLQGVVDSVDLGVRIEESSLLEQPSSEFLC